MGRIDSVIFTAPIPFAQALESLEARSVFPTSGSTADLAKLDPAIRLRALFSATVTEVGILDEIESAVSSFTAGRVDQSTLRVHLRDVVKRSGYRADPEDFGTLRDLTSDRRLNLILETNRQLAEGYGHHLEGQDPAILDEWPAQELVRVIDSKVKRNWKRRWIDAGGRFWAGPHRMIALKNDPVWRRLSRFDLPYAPFDFNSGMDLSDVDRDEAVELGLIDEDTPLFPAAVEDLNATLQATPDVRSTNLRGMLEETGLGTFDEEGVFHFKPDPEVAA